MSCVRNSLMNRPLRFGRDGTGRSLGYGGAPKVARGEITSAYDVDVRTLTAMQDVFDNEDKKSLMKRPSPMRGAPEKPVS